MGEKSIELKIKRFTKFKEKVELRKKDIFIP